MNDCERFEATLEAFELLKGKLNIGIGETATFQPGPIEVPDSVINCIADGAEPQED